MIKSAWDWNVECFGRRNRVESAQNVCNIYFAAFDCQNDGKKTIFFPRNRKHTHTRVAQTFHMDNLTCEFSPFYFQICAVNFIVGNHMSIAITENVIFVLVFYIRSNLSEQNRWIKKIEQKTDNWFALSCLVFWKQYFLYAKKRCKRERVQSKQFLDWDIPWEPSTACILIGLYNHFKWKLFAQFVLSKQLDKM